MQATSEFVELFGNRFIAISYTNGDLQILKICSGETDLTVIHQENLGTCYVSLQFNSSGMLIACSPDQGLSYFQFGDGSFKSIIEGPIVSAPRELVCADQKLVQHGTCYVACESGDRGIFGTFKEDIPIVIEFRSDQVFRGCTGLWMLREYNSDRHHSMMVVSFVRSTVLIRISCDPMFEDISDTYGLEINQRTLAIDNARAGSFLIQVCSRKVLICKSNYTEFAEPLAKWELDEASENILAAKVDEDYVFAINPSAFYLLQCRTTRGAPAINLVHELTFSKSISALAVCLPQKQDVSPSTLFRSRHLFFVAFATGNRIEFKTVYVDDNSLRMDDTGVEVLESDWYTNEMQFYDGPFGWRLAVGGRDGRLTVLTFKQESESGTLTMERRHTLNVGDRPVQLFRAGPPNLHSMLFALAGPACLLEEHNAETFKLNIFLPRADHIVYWEGGSERDSNLRFLAIERESLFICKTTLVRTPRIETICECRFARFIHLREEQGQIVLISSPGQQDVDSPSSPTAWSQYAPTIDVLGCSEYELILRSTLTPGDIITCSACIPRSDLLVLGLLIQGVGQIRVLRIPSGLSDKNTKKRISMPSTPQQHPRGTPSQLSFLCDAGFPYGVTSVAPLRSLKNGVYEVLVASGRELHLIEIEIINETIKSQSSDQISTEPIKFILSESWRSEITAVAVSEDGELFAISTQRGGLDIYYATFNPDSAVFIKRWSSPKSILADRLIWCARSILIVSDRRGYVHIFGFGINSKVVKKSIAMCDVPVAMSYRRQTDSVIISSISGSVSEVALSKFDTL